MKYRIIPPIALIGLLLPYLAHALFINYPCTLLLNPLPRSWCVDSNGIVPQVYNGRNWHPLVRSLRRRARSSTAIYSTMDVATSNASPYFSLPPGRINQAPSSNPGHRGRLTSVRTRGDIGPTKPRGVDGPIPTGTGVTRSSNGPIRAIESTQLAASTGRTGSVDTTGLTRPSRYTRLTGPSPTGTISGVINVKDSPYGALGNDTGNDQPAIQAAYNAACAEIQNRESVPSVYFPAGIYKTTSPLAFNCANAQPLIFGAGNNNTIIDAEFIGPAIVGSAAVTFPSHNAVTVTNNIIPRGSGSSLTYGSNASGFQDLNETLGMNNNKGNHPLGPFSGLSAFDIQGHIKPTDVKHQHCIWASDGALNTQGFLPAGNLGNAYGIMGYLCVSSTGKLYGAMNIGGAMTYLNSGSTKLNNGTEYEVEMNYSSSTGNANLYLGSGTVTRVAQNSRLSGNIVERADENNIFGGDMAAWPYISFTPWQGALQSFRFSNRVRNAASRYTEDIGGYTKDSNTLWLENLSLSEFPHNTAILQIEAGMSGGPWWQTWHDDGSGCCTGTLQIRDIGMTGEATFGIVGNAQLVDLDHVTAKGSIVGIFTSANSSFFSIVKNGSAGDAELGSIMLLGGLNKISHEVLGVGGFAGVLSGNSIFDHLFFETNSRNICGLAFTRPSGVIDADSIEIDGETGGNYPAFCIQGYTSPITIRNSPQLVGNGPLGSIIKIYGNIGKLTLEGNDLSYGIGVTALVDASNAILNAGGSQPGLSRVIFKNNLPTVLPPGISYTNRGLEFDADDGPTQFANLQMPVLPNVAGFVDSPACSSSPCTVTAPPALQVGRIEVVIFNQGSGDGTITPPSGWTLGCTANDHSASFSNFETYWHVIGINDGNTSWSYTGDGSIYPMAMQIAGANQLNPIGLCQASTTASNTSNKARGGSSDINALTILIAKNSGGLAPTISSPPTDFYTIDPTGFAYYAYLPRSTTVPSITMTAASAVYWGNLQMTILPDRIQSALMPFNEGSPPCWYGESGCSLNGLFLAGPAPVISSCGGTIAPTKGSSNSFGEVRGGGAATACTVTFANGGFPNFAACSLTDETTTKGLTLSSLSKKGFTTNNITPGDKFTYACGGN